MNRLLLSLAGISALILLLPHTAGAFQNENQSYLPLSDAETARSFPVEYVGTWSNGRPGYFPEMRDRRLPERLNVGASGARVSVTDDEDLSIYGSDRDGKEWRAELGPTVYSCRFYVADLDRNGLRDLLLLFPTGGNGLAPTSHLYALTFDERGRPVPFEADGYFEEKGGRVFDLVDLDRDGRAELIYMNFDDGYWITNLYEVAGARWRRVRGRHSARSYPLYTRFTNRPNRKPTTPKRGRHPFAPDLSNDAPVLRGRLLSYQWADVSVSEDITLTLEDARGEKVQSRPVSWYSSFALVLDSEEGRRIISLSAGEEAFKAALDEVVKKRCAVALYGRRRPDASSPEILWARTPSAAAR
ncbi:MAG TPA: hypothetical protein VJ866_00885 [Pyrinomonadaceae bacterium]|nr:hypothetical protein [Pyrinomonadaceae bacterium]